MSATLSQNMLLAVPLAPLVGAIAAGLFGKQIGRKGAHWITCIGVAISLAISVQTLLAVIDGARFNATIYEWMTLGALKMEIGFLVDGLTAMMMVVVTFVSLMVHIYTIGYMADDPGYQRFFSYISLFTFSMLMLVMSNNFLQLFFGWEAVGLVSYLLIGFWFTRPTAIFANMKAFLVNRVGDFGFILGIGLIVAYGGTLNYGEAFAKGPEIAKLTFPGTEWMLITVTCICLFIGAMGKSAQFPLHVWLPDSMEGPTPISALIHAATMVTAGIFMVARMSPLFELSDTALSFVMIIGAITALFMGFLGIIQNDIKRVVAYSTLSQLGYMTVALGVSAYSVAVFHLMTHAFFKALLFLAAGSVIIGMHHDQDIRNMGGLRKYMPITWITFLLGTLALVGTPFFSGFYSKENIIEAAGGWDGVVLVNARNPDNAKYEQKTISQIARETGKDPVDAAWDLVAQGRGRVMAIYHMMGEQDIETALRFPWTSIGSDAGAVAQLGAPDQTGLPHPRSFGNAPRVIARYVKERKVLTLPEAVRKMTGWPATRMRLANRGTIAVGNWADVTIFDYDKLEDRATYERPMEFPTGIEWVLVNGVVTIDHGKHTGAKAGQVLLGPGASR